MQAFSGFWGSALKNKAGNIGQPVGDLLPAVEALWRQGVQGIAGSPIDQRLLQRINFPGRLILLAAGKRATAWPQEDPVPALVDLIVPQAYQKPRITEAGVSPETLTNIVKKILSEGKAPCDWFVDWEIRGELAEVISEVVKRNGFPDLVSGGTLTDLISWRVARIPGVREKGITEAHIENALTFLTSKENRFTGVAAGDLGKNLPLALDEAAKALGVPMTGEDALTAIELLVSGEFFRDAASSIEVTLRKVPQVLVSVPSDVVRLPWRIFGLARALVNGVIRLPGDAPQFIKDLVNEGAPKTPALLSETLEWLYSNGTFRNAADLVWELTAPDNESLRLALIVLAGMHGVRVTPESLDGVREIFRTDAPNLGPAIMAGTTFFKERYGDRVPEVLQPFLMN